mmetsp:Transcript_34286/g.84098  ORF Transcript_34286/g.84098 Transcript_34286/m.84098 type:complete len:205 (-) Transcript_34286:146-760(-)
MVALRTTSANQFHSMGRGGGANPSTGETLPLTSVDLLDTVPFLRKQPPLGRDLPPPSADIWPLLAGEDEEEFAVSSEDMPLELRVTEDDPLPTALGQDSVGDFLDVGGGNEVKPELVKAEAPKPGRVSKPRKPRRRHQRALTALHQGLAQLLDVSMRRAEMAKSYAADRTLLLAENQRIRNENQVLREKIAKAQREREFQRAKN